jgi:hypothetical protein
MRYDVDSLISAELRNWVRAELKATVQLLKLNEGGRSVKELAGLVASRPKLVQRRRDA